MKKQKHSISLEIIKLTKDALNKVGEEEFDDIGPDDLMDLFEVTERYYKLPLKEKIQISEDLKEYLRCSETLSAILMRIEHALMEKGKEIDRKELVQILEAGHENMKNSFSDLFDTFQGS